MELLKIVLTLTAISVSYGYLLVHDAPRKVVKVLTVDNGGRWGDWHGPHFCAAGTYAVGYNMKVRILLSCWSLQKIIRDSYMNAWIVFFIPDFNQKVSEYDQEIPQSQYCRPAHGTVRKNHRTFIVTIHM